MSSRFVHVVVCIRISFLFLFFKVFVCLFDLAVLGLHCRTQAFSSCGKRELLFIAVCGLLIAVASLVAKCRL